ncbi:MAG: hypothetical protein JJ953_10280 [Gracilimonas sp.]|uniref:c-type cytochrome domain-containing protein n=1 Tax=Gracilimonas TaxID=649462 RepID=UPI001B0844AA|nr:c-type cytochrome domain-containing protein [Gracilimonas sp.]MBO6586481.1 hypothetical protein [Gracilimonas sp.]MBO6615138.1 hypothetical protein [Gracilimonas sp.]
MRYFFSTLVLFLLFFSVGCISNVEDISETPDIDPNDISYSADIQPILTSNCGSCHINSSTNGVNLTSYNSTINSMGSVAGGPIVVPGEPENSPLVEKIKPDPSYGSRMPTTGQYLTTTEIAQIEAWIAGGAEDN